MNVQLIIQLPVRNLDESVKFYKSLGLKQNNLLSDQQIASFDFNTERGGLVLMEQHYFETLTRQPVTDRAAMKSHINVMSVSKGSEVDTIMEKALHAGAREYSEPLDHGWVYFRSFIDPEDYLWRVMYVDKEQV